MSLPEVLLWQRLKGSPGGVAFRTRALEGLGYTVLRVAAAEVLKSADETAAAVLAFAQSPLRQSLRDCHLPVPGRIEA